MPFRHKGWRTLIQKRKMSVGVVDLSDPKRPSFARVNGRVMMYAASLPKIAVLLAAYVCFEDGTLEETREIQADLIAMIRTSSNQAATRLIDLIGFQILLPSGHRKNYQPAAFTRDVEYPLRPGVAS